MSARDVIDTHEKAGRYFEAASLRSFVLERGTGDVVLLMHGVPASSFLYRKVIAELAARGLRGLCFDLIGLGLADRPRDFDYTWSGLGRFAASAVDALGLERFHLVVHDLGGPVGYELAHLRSDRVLSLTLLDTIVEPHTFSRPWPMAPFAVPVLGEVWLHSMNHWLFRQLWYLKGIADRSSMTLDEIGAHLELLRVKDRGRAFLQIMKGFELTKEKSELYRSVLTSSGYPVQVIWGVDDTALTLEEHGEKARSVTGQQIQRLPGKHFFQEEQAPAIAALIQNITGAGSGREKSEPSPS